MSETPGIDQNGGAIEETLSTGTRSIEFFQTPSNSIAPLDTPENTMEDTVRLDDTDTQADISLNKKDPHESSQSSESNINENQAGKEKVNKPTNENDNIIVKTEEEATNQSRELKLLLALSKEAKLDTNLSRKRKGLNLRKKAKIEGRFSTGKIHKIQYPVTAESELEMELQSTEANKTESKEEENTSGNTTPKAAKRKKISLSDASGDGGTDDTPKKTRKSLAIEVASFKLNKDIFCWRCHKEGVNISCETCPRSYHQRCLKQTINDPNHWPCPECVSILKAESTQTRSSAMKGMTLEHLCSLLKFAVNRMIQCQGSEPFIHAVNDIEFPDYKKYIIQPMDLTLLEKNIKENLYGSTQAFEADAKWILHNSIIFNSYQSKLTTVAKGIIKICKQEMAEIENCPSCYLNANTKKKTWFIEVCPKPHLLVWAKLRGFPFWPGKAMSCKDGNVDVRFFGAHDRAWVPEKECFLYSPKDPNAFRQKRADIEQCVEELNVHVQNLKKIYGEFHFPTFKTPLDPDNELKQLQMFLPRYRSYFNKHKFAKRHSIEKDKTEIKQKIELDDEVKIEERKVEEVSKKEAKKEVKFNNEDETMEGYGTDDEAMPEIDTEMRKTLLKSTENIPERENHEADEDDTQVPTNTEPDTSGLDEFVLTNMTMKSFSAKSPTSRKSDSEPSSKRQSFDDSSPLPIQLFRRNSETKTDSTRVSDKINRIDISENMEISLGNDDKGSIGYSDNISSSNSECSSDFSVEIKKRPVQVDVDNAEFTISPVSKLKMVDKLIKRLSDENASTSGENSGTGGSISNKVEQAKINLSNEKLNQSTSSPKNPKEIALETEKNIIEAEPSTSSKFEDPVSSTNFEFEASEENSVNKADEENDKREATSNSIVQERLNDESEESAVNITGSAIYETTRDLDEQEIEPEDTQNEFPDEIVHEDLHINETKHEVHTSEIIRDSVDTNDEEDGSSSDETSTDDNKPLSVLVKDGNNKGKEDYQPVPKLKIVLKAVRSEEKLDQAVKNPEEEQSESEKSLERRRSKEAVDQYEVRTLDEQNDKEPSSESSNLEAVKNIESNSPQKQTISFKIVSPDKGMKKYIIRSTQENPNDSSHEEETSNKIEEKSQSPVKDSSKSSENSKSTDSGNALSPRSDKKDKEESPEKDGKPQKEVTIIKDVDDDEAMDTMEEVDLNIDKEKIINIIHSSLSDISTSPDKTNTLNKEPSSSEPTLKSTPSAVESKKRKLSHEDNEESPDSQSKMLKLVSIESIMNKVNDNQENNREKPESNSILKISLQNKKIERRSSAQESKSSSTRSSVHEVMNEDTIKSEPDSEVESSSVQDLEAKKKYLSALNILEKGEADVHKPKPNEIRTRSKTEEKRGRFRVSREHDIVDNMTKIIEDVAVNYSANHEGEALPPPKTTPTPVANANPDGCEIYVKSFAKIVPDTPEGNSTPVIPIAQAQQRARKSFPQPNYARPVIKPISPATPSVSKEQPKSTPSTPSTSSTNEVVVKVTPKTSMSTTSSLVSTVSTSTSQYTPKATVPPLQPMEGIRPTNGYLILQQPQQENLLLLPPNQAISYTSGVSSQMLSVTPCLVSAPTHNQIVRHLTPTPQIWTSSNQTPVPQHPNVSESQNYIPQGEFQKGTPQSSSNNRNTAPSGSRKLVNGLPEPATVCSAEETPANARPATPTSSNIERSPEGASTSVPERPQPVEPEVVPENGENDEFGLLNSLIPENVSRAVSGIIRRPPPKLKPRPPGMLSQQFSEGTPTSAGPVTARINSIAHRLGDYFRGMLIETLDDFGKTNTAEATVTSLKLEIETLKHKHSIELSEIEKNMCTVLKDIQRSIIDDRERIIEETRAACEVEAIKRVEEAKSKQWCANCSKEAQFYCCWNTSYCDYPCQQKHWPNHMSKCTQNINQATQITPTSALRPGGQQLILRPANPPPKSSLGRVISKPIQKVYMNRNITAPKTMRVQTSSGLLTMMETTPGNYQLMGNNSIVRTSTALSNMKPTNIISVSSAGSSSINTSPQQKSVTSKQPVRVLTHPIPVATVLEDDSD